MSVQACAKSLGRGTGPLPNQHLRPSSVCSRRRLCARRRFKAGVCSLDAPRYPRSPGGKNVLKEAKEQKHQNYLKDSKDVYPEFNQRTDSVVTTKGHIRSVIQAHNRMKAKLATLPPVSLKPGEGVKSVPVFGPIDYNKEKLFKDRKTGEYISKMIVKKGTGKRLNKKKY